MTFIREIEGGVEITIKAVPGASRDRIVGPLGDALKLQVSAPPEKGKANQAIIALIAKALGISTRTVSVVRGETNPRKTVRVERMSIEIIRSKLLSDAQTT
jgi:uncharacterized protein